MSWVRNLVCVGALFWLAGSIPSLGEPAPSKSKDAQVSYYKEIRPIFQQHCQGCHQPARAKGEFVMTSYANLLKKGASEHPGLVPGQVDKSNIVRLILPQDGKAPSMPRGKPPLKESQVELIKKWIAQGAKDDTPPLAKQVVDAEHPPKYDLPPVITGLDYSPDGKLLAVTGYHEVLLHNADGSGLVDRLIGLSDQVQSVAFSPDGKYLAVAGGAPCRFGEVQIWDVSSKKLRLSATFTFDTLSGISWSPDGDLVAFACKDSTIRAIDPGTGKQVLFSGAHTDWSLATDFSLKGSHIVSVGRDMSLKLTEVGTQRFIDNITSITPGALKGGLMCVDRHPAKEEVLVGGSDGSSKIYRIYRQKARKIGDDYNRIRTFPSLPGRVFSVRYSKDGTKVMAGSSYNGKGEVRVFEEANAKQVSKFEGQKGGVFTTAFHPDGKQAASAGFDGVVRINDVQTGKLIKEFVPVPLATGNSD